MIVALTLEAMDKLTVRSIGCLAVAAGSILRLAGLGVRIAVLRRRTCTRPTGVAARPSRCTEKAKNGVPFIEKRFNEKNDMRCRNGRSEWSFLLVYRVEVKGCVVFTGSEVLYNQLMKYQEHLPFIAIIRKINDFYSFT